MQLATTFIRDNHFVIRDVDGTEIAFSAADALEIQHDLHNQYVDLVEIAHKHEPMNATQEGREQAE
jgi:hypothetical protein